MHFVDWIVDQELIEKWRENNGPSPLTAILYGGDGGLKPASSAMTAKGKLRCGGDSGSGCGKLQDVHLRKQQMKHSHETYSDGVSIKTASRTWGKG